MADAPVIPSIDQNNFNKLDCSDAALRGGFCFGERGGNHGSLILCITGQGRHITYIMTGFICYITFNYVSTLLPYHLNHVIERRRGRGSKDVNMPKMSTGK